MVNLLKVLSIYYINIFRITYLKDISRYYLCLKYNLIFFKEPNS